uniref:Uncharacterized protein n=1 Tax=Rhizophora mucronata TaxID=61149 RepID=A0A2P2QB41_RHIMU
MRRFILFLKATTCGILVMMQFSKWIGK